MEARPGLRRCRVVDSRGRTIGMAMVKEEVGVEDVLVEAGELEEGMPSSELEDLLKYNVEQEARVMRNLVKDIVGEIVTAAVKTSYEACASREKGKEGSKMSMSKTLAAVMAKKMLMEMKEKKEMKETEKMNELIKTKAREVTRTEELLSKMNEKLPGKEAITPDELIKPPVSKEEEATVNRKTKSDTAGAFKEFCIKLESGKVKCKLCGKVYRTCRSFVSHMTNIHLPDETCPGCGKEFRPNHLFRHQQQCNGLPEPPGFIKQLSLKKSKPQEECPKCSKKLFGNMKRHLVTCKGQSSIPAEPSQTPAPAAAREGRRRRKRSTEVSEDGPGTSDTKPSKLVKEEEMETEAAEVKVEAINGGVKGEVMASTETEVMEEDSVDSLHLVNSSDDD